VGVPRRAGWQNLCTRPFSWPWLNCVLRATVVRAILARSPRACPRNPALVNRRVRIPLGHAPADPQLREHGGAVGYDACPSTRGRGNATAMPHVELPLARDIGMDLYW
jgi:hypothetical protein